MMQTSLSHIPRARPDWIVLVLLTLCVSTAVSQRDPISDFCRRWGHQTAVVDSRLYVDGGLLTWGPNKPQNFSNTNFIYHDLASVSDSGMPPPYSLDKNLSIPSVVGGVLWPDTVNKYIYLFGGQYYNEAPWPLSLYAYDIVNEHWLNLGIPASAGVTGLSYGAGLSISSRGEGYYYGGWSSNVSDPNWGDGPGVASSSIWVYDMNQNTWTNNTGPDDVGRAEGVMVYIPAGDGGLLVYFGGVQDTGNGNWTGQPMDQIFIYDVLSGKAYTQNATGDVPDNRRRFCAGATWADDQSSYNIYLYGGLGEEQGSLGFDDVYVLSIPSFTWIRMYPLNGNSTGDNPHHSLTCNVVNQGQMIIHGGFFPENNDCDVKAQWGLHNVDLGEQNDEKALWQLYSTNKTRYVVPDDVIKVVGGGRNGGATKTVPEKGFNHRDLQVLMTRTASVAARTPTRSLPGSVEPSDKGGGLSTGAIAGIAVGGAVALVAGIVACFCLIRRRRRKLDKGSQVHMVQSYDYHHPSQPSVDSNNLSQGPWSPQSSHYSATSPPPFSARPQTVPPHVGPPAELPAGLDSDPVQASPSSEMGPGEPKYDSQGNLWTPQVSMMQVPSAARSPDSTPQYDGALAPPPLSNLKHDMGTGQPRMRTPQELDGLHHRDMTESEPSTQGHLTYYHP